MWIDASYWPTEQEELMESKDYFASKAENVEGLEVDGQFKG